MTPSANILATCLMLLGTALDAAPGTSPVKVNEITLGASGFVELRNTGTTAADIGGWSIQSCADRAPRMLAAIPPSTVVPPGEYFVIAGSAFSGTLEPGLVVDTVSGSGVIARNRHGAHTDSVGLTSSSPCREDSPATACLDSSLGRDSASTDTDHNGTDFTCRIPTPGESNH